jgi:D-3-phosphoglycerate dehydrogenase
LLLKEQQGFPRFIVHTDQDHPVEQADRDAFEQVGAHLVFIESGAEFRRFARNAVAILNSNFRLSAELIEQLTNCLVISRYGSGVDNIDVAAATRMGIPVSNVPVFCVEEVANRAFTLLLACAANLIQLDRSARGGAWGVHNLPFTAQIEGRTLGLVGYGKIARAMARRADAFGLAVIACDPYIGPEVAIRDRVSFRPLDDLVAESDFLSIHTPLTAETYHLIDARRIACMKPTAILVNTARGPVVEEAALLEALAQRRIAGAGLDVFEKEPAAKDHPLFSLDNVIVTPHCAAHTAMATEKVRRGALDAVFRALRGEWPVHVVNPEVRQRQAAAP